MTALYELVNLRLAIDAALEASFGEVTPEIEAALNAHEQDFPAKVESVALYICDLEGDAEKIKAEEERLAVRRSVVLNRAKNLTAYLARELERAQLDRVKGTLKTVAFQNNPPSVVEVVACDQADLRNVATFAPEFVRHTPEVWEWDKNAIKAAAKAGPLPADIAKRVKVTTGKRLAIK